MGLFDFARNIGKKIGLTDNEPDPKDAKAVQLANQRRSIALTGEIKGFGLNIKNLKIAFAAGKAVIEGQAASPQWHCSPRSSRSPALTRPLAVS